MRTPLVAANWKTHGDLEGIAGYLQDLAVPAGVEVVVFPPAVFIHRFAESAGFAVGAQDVGEHPDGAHTGELAPSMVLDVGGAWTLVGHSERRQDQAEDDDLVARKVGAAQTVGLRPLLCVGETLAEREAGQQNEVVQRQMNAVIGALGIEPLLAGGVAYEPVWAIGTGQTATPEQAQEMHRSIRAMLAEHDAEAARTVRILYGGSVKPDNAGELFAQPDIDGGLVGGASLVPTDFSAIIAAAAG